MAARRRKVSAEIATLTSTASDDNFLHPDKDFLNRDSNNLNKTLLWQWAHHKDTTFHHFTPSEATAIRDALLRWYRSSRRKLPWRGDPPPYDGSTAGIATNKSKTKALVVRSKIASKQDDDKTSRKKQTSLDAFFVQKLELEINDSGTACDNHIIDVAEGGDDLSHPPALLPISAYGVWVSEIMLQQTRVEAVIPYWIAWMTSFPTVEDLAMASEDQVNAHWAGLGFYRRARLLHEGAKYVVKELDGKLPTTATELQRIGGIGPYTASAIASIAFDECVPVVDGNVCRVLSRLRGICHHIKAPVFKDRYAWDLAKQIVEAGSGEHAGEVNQALMELGATYCAPASSGTDDRDPLKPFYMSTKLAREYARIRRGDPELHARLQQAASCEKKKGCKVCDEEGIQTVLENLSGGLDQLDPTEILDPAAIAKCGHAVFPMPPPKQAKREEVLAVLALKLTQYDSASDSEDRWLLVKRPNTGLLAGQWEFPSVCVWTSEDKALQRGKPRKDMSAQVPLIDASERSEALSVFLEKLTSNWGEVNEHQRQQLDSPVEHIFSHVRHTMWIEVASIQPDRTEKFQLEWKSPCGREVRWLSESDMKSVGVTSGVKRIIATVKQHNNTKPKPKKRKQ